MKQARDTLIQIWSIIRKMISGWIRTKTSPQGRLTEGQWVHALHPSITSWRVGQLENSESVLCTAPLHPKDWASWKKVCLHSVPIMSKRAGQLEHSEFVTQASYTACWRESPLEGCKINGNSKIQDNIPVHRYTYLWRVKWSMRLVMWKHLKQEWGERS